MLTTRGAHNEGYDILPRDSEIIELWLESQASTHTRGCDRRDVERLKAHTPKPLNQISLGHLQSFAQQLVADGLAPSSRAGTLAAVKSLFGFCQRLRYLSAKPGHRTGVALLRTAPWPSGSLARTT